jgi:8-oxo-dGTP pyrophosphatase MutT (NUDIX family)
MVNAGTSERFAVRIEEHRMTGIGEARVIEAAGGVVAHESPEGPLYAIIRRDRYGVEWVLPKGKREPGEAWQETALREVAEETGLTARIVGVAGAAGYQTGTGPKIVLYWHMIVDDPSQPFTPNEEVRELVWLPKAEAIKRLDHPEEKSVLELLAGRRKDGSTPPGSRRGPIGDRIATGVDRLLAPIMRHRALERVRNHIESERAKVEVLTLSGKRHAAVDHVLSVLDDAITQAAIGNIDAAWHRLHTARALEIPHLEGAALEAAAEELRQEARKLNAWRQSTVEKLLVLDPSSPQIHPQKVKRAAEVVHEHYQNQAYKDGMRRSQLVRLAFALVLGVTGLLLLARAGYLEEVFSLSQDTEPANMFRVLLCLAVLGFCGAAVSAAVSFQAPQQPSRIPELMSTFQMTTLRLALGAVSAIIVFFAVRSAMFSEIFALEVSGPAYLLMGFAAGFSERLVGSIVETVTSKSGTSAR